jgi:hypothetical protein
MKAKEYGQILQRLLSQSDESLEEFLRLLEELISTYTREGLEADNM